MSGKILIVDDHLLVAETLSAFLKSINYKVVFATNLFDGRSILFKDGNFDIVLLDLRLPHFITIKEIESIVVAAKSAKVLLFSAHADKQTFVRAIEVGARGLVPKTLSLASLQGVLDLVEGGQLFFPAEFAERALEKNDTILSDVELFVLREISFGLTNKQIAADLNISESSVKMHMRMICKKLGAKNRAHAVALLKKSGEERSSAFPRQTYPTGSVVDMTKAV